MDLSSVPAHARAGLLAMNAGNPLANLDPKTVCMDVIARYMDGESISKIADGYGLKSTERLYQLLVEHAEDHWKRATTARALARHDTAIRTMEQATDGLSLSRGREVARTAQWELERVCRRIYGTDPPQVNIQVNLGEVGNRIAELEAELLSQRNTGAIASPTTDTNTQVTD